MSSKQFQPRAALIVAASLLTFGSQTAVAQFGPPPGPSGPARDVAPIDLTGQWVSVVTEDWLYRMFTPAIGDFPGIPLNQEGRRIANQWDPAAVAAEGNACKSYGAAAIMRVPGRIRISWDDESTLEVQTDAGRQTRIFHFDDPPPAGEPDWQGRSAAEWIMHGGGRGQPPQHGTLRVVTTGMKAGFLRKNGVPVSENAVVTEYFDLLEQPDGTRWLVVKTIVDDPVYYTQEIITSSNFRREGNRRGWDPRDCTAQ